MSTAPALSAEAVASALRGLGVPESKIPAAVAAQGLPAPTRGVRGTPKAAAAHQRPETVRAWARSVGLPEPVAEYRFHPTRLWRADYLFEPGVLVEIEGHRDHTTRKGLMRDCEKHSIAQILGFIVLRVTPKRLFTQGTATMIRDAIARQQRRREDAEQALAAAVALDLNRPK